MLKMVGRDRGCRFIDRRLRLKDSPLTGHENSTQHCDIPYETKRLHGLKNCLTAPNVLQNGMIMMEGKVYDLPM